MAAVRGTEAETTYWTKQLAGVKPFKVIPDRLRPTVPTTNARSYRACIRAT